MKTPSANRFMIQFLLYRYEVLLNQLNTQFDITEEQKVALREKILTVSWVQGAFEDQAK